MPGGVLILDFGSQYTQLIARRVRELRVFSEIAPYDIPLAEIRRRKPGALILSGGPASVTQRGAPRPDPKIFEAGIPLLGICYGLQLLALASGMQVEPACGREYGLARLDFGGEGKLLSGITSPSAVWMSHGDKITQMPAGFQVTGRTESCDFAVVENPERGLYGVQFHPEVAHTVQGRKILSNFLFSVAALEPSWKIESFLEAACQSLRERIGSGRVMLGLSGGVDSTVLAVLLRRAVGHQLTPVFVDTGLLRRGEYAELMAMFSEGLKLDVLGIDASATFLARLAGVRSPERKRKIIGRTFIDVFAQAEKKIGRVPFFAQGTLYPDVIESTSVRGPSATIKSHHNVGGLPGRLRWKLVEPLRELFKDEVRSLGRELGLPASILCRHPFPGPGLAVRIVGAVTEEKVERLRAADAILLEELRAANLYDKVWQAFVVLLPVKSVGVMGDERTYENAAALRLVESVDGMTADVCAAPPEFLQKVAGRIVGEVRGINRVLYDLTTKPPGTIEWE